MVKYTTWAHGTREEIITDLTRSNLDVRSENKQREIPAAVQALQLGASYVRVGVQHYVVRGEAEKAFSEFVTVMDGSSA